MRYSSEANSDIRHLNHILKLIFNCQSTSHKHGWTWNTTLHTSHNKNTAVCHRDAFSIYTHRFNLTVSHIVISTASHRNKTNLFHDITTQLFLHNKNTIAITRAGKELDTVGDHLKPQGMMWSDANEWGNVTWFSVPISEGQYRITY